MGEDSSVSFSKLVSVFLSPPSFLGGGGALDRNTISRRSGQNTHWCLNTFRASKKPASYFLLTDVPSNRKLRNAVACVFKRRISAWAFLMPVLEKKKKRVSLSVSSTGSCKLTQYYSTVSIYHSTGKELPVVSTLLV